MELRAYFRIVRRWAWLIAIAAAVAGAITFSRSRTQPAQYQASATVQVGSALTLTDPSTTLIQTGVLLAQNYAEIVKTYPVLKGTVDALQLPFSPEALKGLFGTRLIANTSLMVITVTYTEPVLAADIANTLAQQLVENSPTNLSREQQEQARLLNDEMKRAQTQLNNTRGELEQVDQKLRTQTLTEAEYAELVKRRDELSVRYNLTQSNFAQLSTALVNLRAQGGTANVITIIEEALVPTEPLPTSTFSSTLLSVLAGAVIALGGALVVEYLNDSVRSPSEVQPLLGVSLLGTVAPFGQRSTYKDKLIVWLKPRSTITEAYRAIRVNLMHVSRDETGEMRHVYVVTSPSPSEGKSVTAANLAVTFASTGMQVLLIDADMRRPTQHLLFDQQNNLGLSNILTSSLGMVDTSNPDTTDPDYMRVLLNNLVKKTEIPGLDLIPSGPSPTNPAELLGTVQMQALVRAITEQIKYDLVIFDTPPVLTVSDTSILANLTSAEVILVINSGRTRRASAARAVQQLSNLSMPVAGVIMNRLHPRDVDAGYGGYYYYGYYGYGYGSGYSPRRGTEMLPPSANGERPVPALSQYVRRRGEEDAPPPDQSALN
ncbi:MAG: polysaccharide biosynthesis tyrosine autokinase [Anaerolinea sp.]|nr:polysaccharide biosynthesis tyrosine autokinase [Anaerolinea sp.]